MTWISAALDVTQQRIDAYGHANGDAEPLHYDVAYARSRGFRDTIAHGTLLVAPLLDLALRHHGPAFLSRGMLAIRWVSPVCAGDRQLATIDMIGEIVAVNDSQAGRPVTIRGRATCEDVNP